MGETAMRRRIYQAAGRVLVLVLLCLLGGLLSATLVRFAPGYGVDERELDPRLSQESVDAIRAANRANSNLLAYYGRFLSGAIHGNFGDSQWLQRPIGELIRERFPVTLRSVLLGNCLAWVAALSASFTVAFFRVFALELSGTLLSGVLIALPTAVVATLAVYLGAPVSLAIAVVIFPKLFRYLRNLFAHAQAQPHVFAAQARGVGVGRILTHHVLPCVAPALFALLGVSLSLAFGAAIPIEALCDSPGIGQLAWQAALNRDLPLIVNLTLLVTLITVSANWLANSGDRRTA
jgi:peptide/nickel transport system permease protein